MNAAGFHAAELSATLRARPGAGPIGRRVEYLASVASTNDRARDLAASGELEGTVVIAGEQTRGRGRSGRGWHSAPDLGLYVSVILRPAAEPSAAPLFGLLAAVAAASAAGRLVPRKVGIEWPNDIVLADRGDERERGKICGVLSESRSAPDGLRDLVIGMGMNVNHLPDDFPADISRRAASLRIAAGRVFEREEVALELLTALDDWYTLWTRAGADPVIEAYRDLGLDLEGCHVMVTGGPAPYAGTTAGLTRDGALTVIRDTDRGTVLIRHGEVLSLRET